MPKRTATGKQAAIVTTALKLDVRALAPHMFARWGQENFFAYAMNHFAIDQLLAYGTEAFPDTGTVVNPPWRTLDRQRRQLQGKQTATLVKLHRMDSEKGADPKDKRLHIHLHTATTVRRNERIAHLLNHLNETCTIYPGTDLQMVFHGTDPASKEHTKGTVPFPADQEF